AGFRRGWTPVLFASLLLAGHAGTARYAGHAVHHPGDAAVSRRADLPVGRGMRGARAGEGDRGARSAAVSALAAGGAARPAGGLFSAPAGRAGRLVPVLSLSDGPLLRNRGIRAVQPNLPAASGSNRGRALEAPVSSVLG